MLSMSGSINKLGAGTVLLWVFSVLPGGVTNQLYFQRVCAIKEEKQIAKPWQFPHSLHSWHLFGLCIWV